MEEEIFERPFVELDSFSKKYTSFYSGKKQSPDGRILYMRFSMLKGITVKEHFHDWIEFAYVIKGRLNYSLGGERFELSSGDLLLNNYNALHGYEIEENSDVAFFQFRHGYLEQLAPCFNSAEIVCNLSRNTASAEERNNLMLMFIAARDCFLEEGELAELGFKGHLMMFLYYLMKDFSVKKDEPQTKGLGYNAEYISLLLDYMHRHYQDSIGLAVLSEEFHLSAAYISRLFKEQLGIGFKDYLNQIRLNNAVYLLVNTDRSLLDISMECGFPNNKSFIESFKQAYNETPNHYRKSHRLKI